MAGPAPMVSVITPVYNGETHLAECIESVLNQTYQDFEYVILNNRSTDGTLEIAQEAAARDSRIRVETYPEHLDVVSSINRAFTRISPDTTYCKLVAADDWLFSNCIDEMVNLAEQHENLGMVSSYVLSGSRVGWDGLPYPSHVTDGRQICRMRFLDQVKVFGGPSASLIRADILRSQVPFYRVGNFHGDNEAYLELLKSRDFGFVHQVLSFRRRGEASRTTSYLQRVDSYLIGDIEELLHFGKFYLTESEYQDLLNARLKEYYQFLAKSVFHFRRTEFWDYHRSKAEQLGITISRPRLTGHVLIRFIDLILNPKRSIESAIENFGRRH